MKIITIDPVKTRTAESGDLWLQLRPGTDLALALGMIHVVINEELYDRDFVENWVLGFRELEAHIQAYTPEKVAQITWVPEELIVKAARLFGRRGPNYIEYGNAIDHSVDSFQTSRAISILLALSGSLDVPGGGIDLHGTGFRYGDTDNSAVGVLGRWSHELELRDHITKQERQKKVDPGLLPDFRYITPQSVTRAILEGSPYSLHAAYIQACNPISSWCDSLRTSEALRKLDFLAVSDLFMTPTAALADILFPTAGYLEFDGIQMPPPPGSFLAQAQRKVAQVGECRSDIEIINGLAGSLGLGEYFWTRADGFWDYVLAPTGLTFREFMEKGRLMADRDAFTYRKFEKRGFKTPSGKVEIYSQPLAKLGFDPLPLIPDSPRPAYDSADVSETYPLICTGRKATMYRHSTGRQIAALRDGHPEPLLAIHPETATVLGLEEGDWAFIETEKGRIKQKVTVTSIINPKVVLADYAWWFPERGSREHFGWAESNYNVLTDQDLPSSPEVGSNPVRGFACKVYKVEAS